MGCVFCSNTKKCTNQKIRSLSEFFDPAEIEEHLTNYIHDIVNKIKTTNIVEIIDKINEMIDYLNK